MDGTVILPTERSVFKVGDKVETDGVYGGRGVVKKITPVPFGKTFYGVQFPDERRVYWFYKEELTNV